MKFYFEMLKSEYLWDHWDFISFELLHVISQVIPAQNFGGQPMISFYFYVKQLAERKSTKTLKPYNNLHVFIFIAF